MQNKLVLNASIRTPSENAKHLRNEKMVVGVVYGKKQEAVSLKFDYSDFLKLYRVAWESKIVTLSVAWKKIDVLVYEVVSDPVKGTFQHVDFYAITKGEKVTTSIPLVFVWNSKAAMEWAMVEEYKKEVEVKVLPTDLVDSFEVDITALENIWDSIRVSDLKIDANKFEILDNPEDIVAIANEILDQVIEETTTEENVEETSTTEENK